MITVNGVSQISWPWERLHLRDVVRIDRAHGTHAALVKRARKHWKGAVGEDNTTHTILRILPVVPKRKYVRKDPAAKAATARKAQRRKWHREQIAAPAIDPFS